MLSLDFDACGRLRLCAGGTKIVIIIIRRRIRQPFQRRTINENRHKGARSDNPNYAENTRVLGISPETEMGW